MKHQRLSIVVLGLTLSVVSSPLGLASPGRVPTADWQRYVDPTEAGFTAAGLARARQTFDESGAAALFVVADGAVVVAWGDWGRRFHCHSIRKSLMSLLYGTCQAQLKLDATLAELEIDDAPSALTRLERQATVLDLLRSRSGIYVPAASERPWQEKSRPQRASSRPGERWWYNTWDFNALLTVFERQVREDFAEAFAKRLAGPLELEDFRIRDVYRHHEPERSSHPAYPFRLSARDLARFGQLLVTDGAWGERRLVPSEWIQESTEAHSKVEQEGFGYDGYGYLWWLRQGLTPGRRLISALGAGETSIDVIPHQRVVSVFRVDTFHNKKVEQRRRLAVLGAILAARTGEPTAEPELETLSEPEPKPGIELSEAARRALCGSTRTVGGPDAEIDQEGGVLFLRLAEPAGLCFDLIPQGEDRFLIEGQEDVAVLVGRGKRRTLLLEANALAVVRTHLIADEVREAERLLELLEEGFPESGHVALWRGEAARAAGKRKRAVTAYAEAGERAVAGGERPEGWLALLPLLETSASAPDKARLAGLPGVYRLESYVVTVRRQGMRLLLETETGTGSLVFGAGSDTFQFLSVPDQGGRFVRDEAGRVVGLALGEGESERVLPRTP